MKKAVQQWDRPAIQALLLTSDLAVLRALVLIYTRQTAGEQSSFSTQVANGRGFTAADAPALTRLAKQALSSVPLSPEDLATARARLLKYSGQLLEAVIDRQLCQLKHSA